MLNFFTFEEERTRFIEISSQKIRVVQFAEEDLNGHDAYTLRTFSGHVPITLTRLIYMVIEYTRCSVKTKS